MLTSHLSSTPFKILSNENDGSILKGSKKVTDFPRKKGLSSTTDGSLTGTKSTRKALGDLSNNQVFSRTALKSQNNEKSNVIEKTKAHIKILKKVHTPILEISKSEVKPNSNDINVVSINDDIS